MHAIIYLLFMTKSHRLVLGENMNFHMTQERDLSFAEK